MNHLCDKAQAVALQRFTKPARSGFFYARLLLALAALAGALLLAGCTDEVQAYAASQADLADAVAQAAKEASHAPARP